MGSVWAKCVLSGLHVGFIWDLPHKTQGYGLHVGPSGFNMGPIGATRVLNGLHMVQMGNICGLYMGQAGSVCAQYGPSGLIWPHMGQCGSKWASYCFNGFYIYPVEFSYRI